MKALTLCHPWPFAVAYLGKGVENREWDDRLAHLMGVHEMTGQLVAIHGGRAPTRPRRANVLPTNPWRQFTGDLGHIRDTILGGELPDAAAQYLAGRDGPLAPEHFILPGIVAVATLSGSTRSSREPWAASGCLHLLLSEVIALPKPVQCPGAQGFWKVPEVIEKDVTAQYRAAINARPRQWESFSGRDWLQ
ncbi:hypothetical protein [uncultured Deinococcus sp.]|uniref:hypothetical protein n=1 Tax=uncultured Deinococcus sp. TaxID=158789 RepID=UPI002584E54E|nr:hypothetical protein [uncultured Deinococcus sp.]